MSDYLKYRGKCKEYSEALIAQHPEYRLVRGHYHCAITGKQEHWWCEDQEGNIIDPTAKQFPTKGICDYEEFNGICTCEQCGKEVKEEDAVPIGRFACCSFICAKRLVGL